MNRACKLLGLAAAILMVMPATVSADWLITREGKKIETSGSWTVKGTKVYFRRPNGALVSVPVGRIDLDRSKSASESPSRRQAARGTTPSKKADEPAAVLTLTNKDVSRYVEQPRSSQQSSDSPGTPGPLIERSGHSVGDLEVTEWNEALQGNILVVTGTLLNRGDTELKEVSLSIRAFDGDDKELALEYAQLSSKTIRAHGQTHFRAELREAAEYKRVKFEPGKRIDIEKLAREAERESN